MVQDGKTNIISGMDVRTDDGTDGSTNTSYPVWMIGRIQIYYGPGRMERLNISSGMDDRTNTDLLWSEKNRKTDTSYPVWMIGWIPIFFGPG